MPFRSKKQRNFLKWKHPDVYKKWKAKYGAKVKPKKRRKGSR